MDEEDMDAIRRKLDESFGVGELERLREDNYRLRGLLADVIAEENALEAFHRDRYRRLEDRYWRLVGWTDNFSRFCDFIPALESMLSTLKGFDDLPARPGEEDDQ